MALTDINFQEGDKMNFIVERPVGTLNAPVDITCEAFGSQYLVLETEPATTSGNIFIMSE